MNQNLLVSKLLSLFWTEFLFFLNKNQSFFIFHCSVTDGQPIGATTEPTAQKYPYLKSRDDLVKVITTMSQGQVFSQKIDPSFYFKWSDNTNRSIALYMATEDKNNLSMFESIYFDDDTNRIWALPMSDNAGQNNYHIMARGYGDNVTSYPYEVLVMPNINSPNHKIILHFEYNYILFEAYLPYRLELLRLLSVILGDGGSFENLTLDSYENTTTNGTSQMLIRISNSSVGYNPCNKSQMNKILNMYGKLSTGINNDPHAYVADQMGNYKLFKVELELIGPCASIAERLKTDESSVLSSVWLKVAFGIILALLLMGAAVATVVCLCRQKKLRAAVSIKKTNSSSLSKHSNKTITTDSNFFTVKSKHVPVIFADEYDEPSSLNQISAASPLILKNEKPPAKDCLPPMKHVNGSLNHSPMNGPVDFDFSFDTLAPNGNGSLSSCMLNNAYPGSTIMHGNSQCSSVSHRYCPSQYRPPPPYKPPSKAIVPS